jgi:hypothetical protein
MISKAREFALPRVTFECCRYENYAPDRQFEAVRLVGVFGWYVPWPGNDDALRRARGLLIDEGILIATYVPPRNLFHWFKSLVFPRRTIVVSARRFKAIAHSAGFDYLFSIDTATSVHAFLRRRPG